MVRGRTGTATGSDTAPEWKQCANGAAASEIRRASPLSLPGSVCYRAVRHGRSTASSARRIVAARSQDQVAQMMSARWRGECAIVSGQPDAHRIAPRVRWSRFHALRSLIDRLTTVGCRHYCCGRGCCLTRQMPSTSTVSPDGCARARRVRSIIRSQHTQAQTRARGCRYSRAADASAAEGHAAHGAVHSHLLTHRCLALPVGSTALCRASQLGISEIRQLQHSRTDAIASRDLCIPAEHTSLFSSPPACSSRSLPLLRARCTLAA